MAHSATHQPSRGRRLMVWAVLRILQFAIAVASFILAAFVLAKKPVEHHHLLVMALSAVTVLLTTFLAAAVRRRGPDVHEYRCLLVLDFVFWLGWSLVGALCTYFIFDLSAFDKDGCRQESSVQPEPSFRNPITGALVSNDFLCNLGDDAVPYRRISIALTALAAIQQLLFFITWISNFNVIKPLTANSSEENVPGNSSLAEIDDKSKSSTHGPIPG